MCAVVRPVSPLPMSPSSITQTRWPALASVYAVVIPAMPAPMTHTSTVRFSLSGWYFGTSAVAVQMDVVSPDVVGMCVLLHVWRRAGAGAVPYWSRSEEHTSELQSQSNLVCRLLLEK